MARTKLTPKRLQGEGGEVGTKTQSRKRENSKRAKEEGGKREEEWAPSPVHHPSPAKKPSPMREVELMVDKAG